MSMYTSAHWAVMKSPGLVDKRRLDETVAEPNNGGGNGFSAFRELKSI